MTVFELPGPRPTLADVARVAGVSSATASRVLNGFPQVRDQTRRRVEQAVGALGYVRQRGTRTVAGHRSTRSIAVAVGEDGPWSFSDPSFGRLVRGAGAELARAGMQVVVLVVRSPKSAQVSAARYLSSGHVDGVLFVSTHARYSVAMAGLAVPVVSAGRPLCGDATGVACVDVDNRGGAAAAVQYLLDSGRRRIATVAGPKDTAPGQDRLAGYLEVVAEAGLYDPGLLAYGDFGQASGEHVTLRLLDRRPDVDAVFVASDLMATGVLRALRRTGRSVPGDVAVVGFGNAPVAAVTDPPLTTVSQPVEALGAQAARELLAVLGGAAGRRRVVLDTALVIRESA
ncbi:LacI family DNA-binding transcriptional regulator [Amycolatopsis sp. NEAU-NG30]|uniref:LacI family DNA-binding transcriptional regulator n=1 Tax=Amycolatopsis melonis TaxID=3156488 RepID=A0ABV0LS86_9PSEU